MAVRLRNLSNIIQTVTIVRPQQTYTKSANPKCFIFLQDDEYTLLSPPLKPGVWDVVTVQREPLSTPCGESVPHSTVEETPTPEPAAPTPDWIVLVKSTSYGIGRKEEVFLDTTSSPLTIILPPQPETGCRVRLSDYAGTWSTNPVTIAGNGAKINGEFTNLTVSKSRTALEMVYVDDAQGWVVPVD